MLCALQSVSNSFKWNIRFLAKYYKIIYTGISDNNMAKFIYYPFAKVMFLQVPVCTQWGVGIPVSGSSPFSSLLLGKVTSN